MSITKQALDNLTELGIRQERLEVLENLLQRFMKDDVRQAILIKVRKRESPSSKALMERAPENMA